MNSFSLVDQNSKSKSYIKLSKFVLENGQKMNYKIQNTGS